MALGAREILDGLACLNLHAIALAVRRPEALRAYLGTCAKKYEELTGGGLPARSPLTPPPNLTVTLPAFHSGGGASFTELMILARVTKTLSPLTVFEMGTYNGLVTAVFILNTSPEARIFTLDLPPDSPAALAPLVTDRELVTGRELGAVPRTVGLNNFTQLFADTMNFDPSPYLDAVDLGFVDAAHDAEHVRNDTIKMARMLAPTGTVFWHDYGGKGAMRPLALYLESLGKSCPIYRIAETSLAWAPARELKAVLARFK